METTTGSSTRSALANAPDRVGQLVDISNPILEQVSHPLALALTDSKA
jgi:hypothetical protein